MVGYTVRRILISLPLLLVLVSLTFLGMHLAPGDPAVAVLGNYASAESLQNLREQMGIDQPLYIQYIDFLSDLVRGDLGYSYISGEHVSALLLLALPYSAVLSLCAIVIAIVIGVPTGIISAIYWNRIPDFAARVFALLGIAMPSYYLSILLILAFAISLNWFPIVGAGEWHNLGSVLHHLVLPALSVGLVNAGIIMRITRSSLLDVMREDYVQTARSKGLAERTVIVKHGLRNAMLPVVAVMGVYAGQIVGTCPITEMIFARPGLGKVLLGSVFDRDYTTIQSSLVIFGALIVSINLLTDLSYGLIDPKVRYS